MFRFTIRDMLWLTAVVALCFGWWLQFKKAEAATRIADDARENAEVMRRIARDEESHHSEEMQRFRTFVELLTAKLKEKGYMPRFREVTRNGAPQIILLEEDGIRSAD